LDSKPSHHQEVEECYQEEFHHPHSEAAARFPEESGDLPTEEDHQALSDVPDDQEKARYQEADHHRYPEEPKDEKDHHQERSGETDGQEKAKSQEEARQVQLGELGIPRFLHPRFQEETRHRQKVGSRSEELA
jgi:hypothetical protein